MTAQTLTLTDFVLARIAEDEAVARDATNDGHRWLVEEETISLWPDDLEPVTGIIHFPRKAHAYHAATWEPARVLAECEAKRRIVEWATLDLGSGHSTHLFRLLAQAYADHPDFQEAWRV